MSERAHAIEMTPADWAGLLAEIGEPPYRARQICAWLWQRGVWSALEMTDLSKPLRAELESRVDFSLPKIEREQRARDGTRKYLLSLSDGALIECAVIDQGGRMTLCASSQVGCPVGCPFCHTGQSGFDRDLTRGEIAAQLAATELAMGRRMSGVVLMGMGEPLLNADNVFEAISMMNDKNMRGLGIRHITLSTSGIIPGIKRMADGETGARLAVSLHAPNDELRDELVPCNTAYPLPDLLAALRNYQSVRGDRITIEYALFDGVNDTLSHARKLVGILRGISVYINLIPGSPNPRYKPCKAESILRFKSVLESAGFESEIRSSRGAEIDAACGMLRRRAAV